MWFENLIVFNTFCVLILFNISECSYDKIRLKDHPSCHNIVISFDKTRLYTKPDREDQLPFACSFFFISDPLSSPVFQFVDPAIRSWCSLFRYTSIIWLFQDDFVINVMCVYFILEPSVIQWKCIFKVIILAGSERIKWLLISSNGTI